MGGDDLADAHLDASCAWLAELPLGRDDRVYVSPLSRTVAPSGNAVRGFATPPAARDQTRRLLEVARRMPGRPRSAIYRVEGFVYS